MTPSFISMLAALQSRYSGVADCSSLSPAPSMLPVTSPGTGAFSASAFIPEPEAIDRGAPSGGFGQPFGGYAKRLTKAAGRLSVYAQVTPWI
jgi:hypothetical protein